MSRLLLVDGAGFTAGTDATPTSLVDLAPTLLQHLEQDATGIEGTPVPRS